MTAVEIDARIPESIYHSRCKEDQSLPATGTIRTVTIFARQACHWIAVGVAMHCGTKRRDSAYGITTKPSKNNVANFALHHPMFKPYGHICSPKVAGGRATGSEGNESSVS